MSKYKVFRSEAIFTGTAERFLDGYVVLEKERIQGVYPLHQLPKGISKQAEFFDYTGCTITPGFIEAHAHVQLSALSFTGVLKPISGNSEAACVRSLQEQSNQPAFINGWVIGKGWYAPHWQDKSLPTKASLDQYFKDYPVMLLSEDLHTIWLNSLGLKALEAYLPPESEDLIRDPEGKLTGVIKEKTAMACLNRILTLSVTARAALYQPYLEHLVQQGYTAVCDLALLPVALDGQMEDQIYPEVYDYLDANQRLPLRAFLFPFFDGDIVDFHEKQRKFQGSRAAIAGGKQFFDGVIGSHTAWMKENYQGMAHSGMPMLPPEKLKSLIFLAQQNQVPLRIHTIGDQAVSTAIEFLLEAKEQFGPLVNSNHCLEHIERIESADIVKLKASGAVASVQPSHPLMDYQKVHEDIGLRSEYMWPVKDIQQQDIPIAFGSDSPVVKGLSPLDNLYYGMTRQTKAQQPIGGWQPQQRLSLIECLTAHTSGASQACSAEEKIGTLETGKSADLAIVEGNLANCSAAELYQLPILATYVNGQPVYQKEESGKTACQISK